MPNPDYSGSPKPSIASLVELPFTSEAAIYNEMRSGGPSAITIGNLPSQYAPQVPTLESAGYIDNKAASYSFNYFPLNFNNPKVGPIFSQLYFRQAFQHLIDQQGWINAFLHNTANPTYGPVPAIAAQSARQRGAADDQSRIRSRSRPPSSCCQPRLEGARRAAPRRARARSTVRARDHEGRGNLVQHRLPVRESSRSRTR